MEIAAYPIPYASPAVPDRVRARAGEQGKDLTSQSGRERNPQEAISQGEVLGRRTQENDSQRKANSYNTYEQQARRQSPDLSGLDSSSRQAINQYLDHDGDSTLSYRVAPLIDVYV